MISICENQFSAMNLLYSKSSMDYFLESISRLGIKNIELWGASPYYCRLDTSLSDIIKIRRKIEKNNLKLVCFTPEQCIYPLNIASNNRYIRNKSIKFYMQMAEVSGQLGTEKLLVTPGWCCYDENLSEGYKRSEESLHIIAEITGKCGVEPVLEILQYAESNLMYNLETTLWYADRLKDSEMNFCIDTVPVRACGQNLQNFFEKLGQRVRHVHLIDGTPTGHLVLGDGEHSIEEHLNALSENDYDGYVTLEFGSSVYMKYPEVHMQRGWEYLKKMLPYRAHRKCQEEIV
ncbi:MAG: TIM barrel protein [Clostridiales bacterium]|nr:TIM barrel protein [Clostridiales bacterium]MDY3748042.1 TIM barrel protein [Lachnospiraceae bacterium]